MLKSPTFPLIQVALLLRDLNLFSVSVGFCFSTNSAKKALEGEVTKGNLPNVMSLFPLLTGRGRDGTQGEI